MKILHLIGIVAVLGGQVAQSTTGPDDSRLSVSFDGHFGQVEVGGRYAGAEFHGSRPLPSRVSFYFPVANSIDLSTDYWKRGESQPFAIGLRVDDGEKHWIGKRPWSYLVSPHTVTFYTEENDLKLAVKYEFCLNEPAMVLTFTITNDSKRSRRLEVYTHLRSVLRTCQTYARVDSAWTESAESVRTLTVNFDSPEANAATVLIQNVGALPSEWTTDARELAITDSGTSNWMYSASGLRQQLLSHDRQGPSAAAFVYRASVPPGDSLRVVQVIGSYRRSYAGEAARRLRAHWQDETVAYNHFVERYATQRARIVTHDASVDASARWALGILAANAHYIDGSIVPMPCPAEYNFFFTHDVLLTDLGAVNFDIPRVKKDLLYIASHSKGNIIPHAYYWRDTGFVTEYCTPDNWNHLWFILVAASYLRHSMDDSTGRVLYPLVTTSLEQILQQRKDDNLMYAFRPDWWDIGHVEGARAYITILTTRALRDYLYLSAALRKVTPQLNRYERMADDMQDALESRLWDRELEYLINYNGGAEDTHYYMGSLLAAVYNLLTPGKASELVRSAEGTLVEPRIGVRTVMPVDFNVDSVKSFFKILDNEAGDPYTYANGGVWPHANAMFALALQAVGRADNALEFFKRTMSLDGIMKSPMGHPAMYEYRYSNPASPDLGRIDKPSFLWAGGFYLYTLYHLLGVNDQEWNVSMFGSVPAAINSASFALHFGKEKQVLMRHRGDELEQFTADGRSVPSRVLPLDLARTKEWKIRFGPAGDPFLKRINAILHSAVYRRGSKTLELRVSSFEGHQTTAECIANSKPSRVLLNGKVMEQVSVGRQSATEYSIQIHFAGAGKTQKVEITF